MVNQKTERVEDSDSKLIESGERLLTRVEFHQLSDVPPEAEWFANITNPNTKRAYRNDVGGFMKFTDYMDLLKVEGLEYVLILFTTPLRGINDRINHKNRFEILHGFFAIELYKYDLNVSMKLHQTILKHALRCRHHSEMISLNTIGIPVVI